MVSLITHSLTLFGAIHPLILLLGLSWPAGIGQDVWTPGIVGSPMADTLDKPTNLRLISVSQVKGT